MGVSKLKAMIREYGNRRLVMLVLAFFLPAMLLVVLMLLGFYRNAVDVEMTKIHSMATKTLYDRQQFLAHQNKDIVNDLLFISKLSGLHEFPGHGFKEHVSHIQDVLSTISDSRKLYRKIRIIDTSGRELVSVERHPGQLTLLLPDSLLTDLRNTPVFNRSLSLNAGEVFVSPIEQAVPYSIGPAAEKEPVLRYATQIRDKHGHITGFVLASCFGQELVRSQLAYGSEMKNQSILLTSDGFFIAGAPGGENWQFLNSGNQVHGSFSFFYPDEWKRIRDHSYGYFTTPKGLFVFRRLYLVTQSDKTDPQSQKDYYLIMILHIPVAVLQTILPSSSHYILLSIVTGMILFVGSVVLGFKFERSRRSRKELELLALNLKEKEYRFRSLFEGSPEAIVLIDAESASIVGLNRKAQEMTGAAESELVGKPFTVLHPDSAGNEMRARFSRHVEEATLSATSIPEETEVLHRNGRKIPVEIISQLIRLDGRDSMYVIYHDLSLRKQTESELNAKTKLLETITGSVPAFVYLKDRNGYYSYANRTMLDMFGLSSPADIVGKTVYDFFPENAAVAFAKDDRNVIDKGEALMNNEEEVLLRDGRVMPVLTNKIPLLNAEGECEGLIGISMDRTEQKSAEERERRLENQLRNNQKLEMLGTLSGGIAHDFNNILTPIIGFTEMAISDLPNDSEVANELDYVLQAAMRAKKMVQHMLVFSRQELPDFRLRKLQAVVLDSIDFLKHSIPSYVVVEKNIGDFEELVLCDAAQIEQVIMNLCTNGWQAMAGGRGNLVISLSRVVADSHLAAINKGLSEGATYAALKVSDNGLGMSSGVVERMFDPFYTTKEVGKGTGLGLSVVYGIIMEHKGVVNVESMEGKGTTIHIYLPLVKSMAADKQSDFSNDRNAVNMYEDTSG
jgi:PAS domain S-box-containing protein